ncbi:ABC transporter ATP-binding protein [Petrachloros mirabilis]
MSERIAAVEISNVSKIFNPGKKKSVAALRDVSFNVYPGQIVGLIGPNGAGKTTLLRILLGFLESDSGHLSVFGEDPTALSTRARTGYQADAHYRSKWMSVRSFLRFHARLINRESSGENLEPLLEQFNLQNVAARSLADLSKGMRQKVELVFAFLGSPDIVFLDEPTASLDPPSVFELRDFLSRQRANGMTVFFSSHNLTEVEHVCDRVFFINEGEILADYAMEGERHGFLEEAFRKHLVERGRR